MQLRLLGPFARYRQPLVRLWPAFARTWFGSPEVDSLQHRETVPGSVPAWFEGETPVHTLHGLVPIERIGVGSQVLSRCETTGKRAYRRVVKKFAHEDRQLLRIDYATAEGKTDTLLGTAEHPFWIKDVGWTEAGRLQGGQVLVICDPVGLVDVDRPPGNRQELALGSKEWLATVISVTTSEYVFPVYDFELEGFHTYFVGVFGVWVHNSSRVFSAAPTRNSVPFPLGE
jgi:filamentous hemagglutinin